MRTDIGKWCRACITCAARQTGRATRSPLTPIPVDVPFDRIGVDVIHFPRSKRGNRYAVCFVDYLTKWVEAFPTTDQSALMMQYYVMYCSYYTMISVQLRRGSSTTERGEF